ncbi:MAG: ribonuclease R [Erysipelotrichales bacterium]|nr:ribonuclease R [Erysipelotrichales bacterium]
MKDKIIRFVQDNPYCTIGNICANFDMRKNDLMLLLTMLEVDGDLIKEDNTYLTPFNLGLIKARIVTVKHHFAFASFDNDDEDVLINEEQLHGAMLNDIVYLRYDLFFEVVKIVKRERKIVVGEVYKTVNASYLIVNGIATDNTRFIIEDYTGENNEIIKCEIKHFEDYKVYVSFIEKLGDKNEPFVDITRILLEYDCPIEFNEEVNSQVANLPISVEEKDLKGRIDLRDELIVTIDGEDSKDLDDAVSAEETDYGYLVGVHIADVSYYVEEYSPLDKEALNRGTSIYVADRVVPMLPFMLSNGICSLNPHVDRLTISCIIKLDKNGEVLSSEIKPSVINSKHRLTYTYVNEVIDENKNESELEKQILLLNKIAKILRKRKEERGELDLAIPELKIKVNNKGEAIGVEKRIQKDGEKLIEDLMILANEVVAETIYHKNLPFIYRIHENPPAKRMDSLISFISRIGLRPHFDAVSVKPKDMQRLLNDAKYSPKYQVIAQVLLRSLAKARYATNNKGHFGLASKCYTHFTSPIRRYPDLIVHRYLRKYLFNMELEHPYEKMEELTYIAENSSIKERRAINVERDSIDMKSAEYMHKFIGMEFKGYISGMSNSGMFVELENGVSGKISFDSMNDFYSVDSNCFNAYGRRKGKRYSLGDTVNVIIENTSKEAGEIYLTIKGEHLSYNMRKYKMNNTRRKSK